LPPLGPIALSPELAEGTVTEHLAVGAQGLLKYLDAVGDEQQPRRATAHHEVTEVQGGDDGLARASRRDDEVPVPAMDRTFCFQLLEDLLLVGVRAHLEA